MKDRAIELGLMAIQQHEALRHEPTLSQYININKDWNGPICKIFLKIKPDIDAKTLKHMVQLCETNAIDGIVLSDIYTGILIN